VRGTTILLVLGEDVCLPRNWRADLSDLRGRLDLECDDQLAVVSAESRRAYDDACARRGRGSGVACAPPRATEKGDAPAVRASRKCTHSRSRQEAGDGKLIASTAPITLWLA